MGPKKSEQGRFSPNLPLWTSKLPNASVLTEYQHIGMEIFHFSDFVFPLFLQDLSEGFMRSTFQVGFMLVSYQVGAIFKVDPTIRHFTLAKTLL